MADSYWPHMNNVFGDESNYQVVPLPNCDIAISTMWSLFLNEGIVETLQIQSQDIH